MGIGVRLEAKGARQSEYKGDGSKTSAPPGQ